MKYDNDGDGYCDVFVIVYVGQGVECMGLVSDLWLYKYVLDGGLYKVDNILIYLYFMVFVDGKLGVCVYEIGYLLFGWFDLYDVDFLLVGIGGWCFMLMGLYNVNGDNFVELCVWCKVNQEWVIVINII